MSFRPRNFAARLLVPGFAAAQFATAAAALPNAGDATLSGTAAPAEPQGWIRLTPDANNSLGMALFTDVALEPGHGFELTFTEASWGGSRPAGDGIAAFLFDAAQGMRGAKSGGGLGYCQGAGAWLGVGMDEFGNFSHPLDSCRNGPGPQPNSVVLRGPTAKGNPWIAAAPRPSAQTTGAMARAGEQQLTLRVWPKPGGYTVAVDARPTSTAEWRALIPRADFPFEAPSRLAIGFAASTGAAKAVHEIGDIQVRAYPGMKATMRFAPASVPAMQASTLTLQLVPGTDAAGPATIVRPLVAQLPAGVEVARPPALGGTCPATVTAVPGERQITVEGGSVVRAHGCTISVRVAGRESGSRTVTLPAGTLLTDSGTNAEAVTATLEVTR